MPRSLSRLLIVVTLIMVVGGSTAAAQTTPALPGRYSIGIAARWRGQTTVGAKDATETASSGGRFQLFRTETALASAIGVEGRIGIRLTRAVEAEASGSFAKPELETHVTADAEGAPNLTTADAVSDLFIGGALVVHLPRMRMGARTIPFVSAGGGFLRELHDGGTLAANGRLYHAGGGLQALLKSSNTGGINAIGVRVDARAEFRSGGVAFDDSAHISPSVGLSVFARF